MASLLTLGLGEQQNTSAELSSAVCRECGADHASSLTCQEHQAEIWPVLMANPVEPGRWDQLKSFVQNPIFYGLTAVFVLGLLLGTLAYSQLPLLAGAAPSGPVQPVASEASVLMPENRMAQLTNSSNSWPTTNAMLEPAPILRERLKQEYRAYVAQANPQLKGIGVIIMQTESDYTLWATHEYFNFQSFQIGDDASLVAHWIEQKRADLKRAGFGRVGVLSTRATFGGSFHLVN